MNKLSKTQRVGWSLLTVFALFVANHFGYAASPDDMMLGSLALAGVGSIDEVEALLKEQGETFEKFKKHHDEKYDRLDKEFTEYLTKTNRLKVTGSGSYSESSYDMIESKNDLANLIRSRGETKGMFSGSGPDGGWTVAPVLQEGIGTIVRNQSALRSLVSFIEIGAGDAYEELLSITPVGASWVGERQARPATDSPKLVKVTTPLHELYAQPVLSQRLSDDSGVAMVDFLTTEVGISFAEAEELALFSGSGVNQPRGLATLATATTGDDVRAFGTIEHVPTGVSGGLHATSPLDSVKELFFALRAGYRTNAKWVCNSATTLLLSQVQDGTAQYYWNNGDIQSGQPMTLLGKEVVICETCPSVAAGSLSLWFGDWNQALRAIERAGNKVLLNPFLSPPDLQVYVYRRMGLQLRNSNAVKVLKFAAA